MTHSLAPHFVKLFYTSGSTPHVQTLQCGLVGDVTPGVEPTVRLKNETTLAMTAAVTAFCETVKILYKATDTFTGYEVYGVDMETDDPFFIYGDDLTIVGTNGGVTLTDGQAVLSFGTSLGNVLKLYFMEPVTAQNQRVPAKVGAANPVGPLVTYFLGGTNWVRGRDDSFPIRGIYWTTKINDMLRKKSLLTS